MTFDKLCALTGATPVVDFTAVDWAPWFDGCPGDYAAVGDLIVLDMGDGEIQICHVIRHEGVVTAVITTQVVDVNEG